jgi:hypothetical protein
MKAAYTAQKPSECYDWITLRDLQRIAITAWKRAKADCNPPRGERWLAEGEPWCSPEEFVESLARLLVLHVQAEAHGAGISGYEYAPAQLSRWYALDDLPQGPCVPAPSIGGVQ